MSDGDVPYVDWSTFDARFRWHAGEHVSLIGPTRLGKSTLAFALAQQRRKWAVGLITKPRDPTFAALARHGWTRTTSWPPPPAPDHRRGQHVLLWPRFRGPEDADNQQVQFDRCFAGAFHTGAWCIIADEIRYLSKVLGLSKWLELFWLQAGAMQASLVSLTQRPAHVPLEVYDQATHLFFFRDNDDANLKRIGGVGWLSSKLIRETVAALEGFDSDGLPRNVLYVNTRDGSTAVTRFDPTAIGRR